MKRNDNMKRQFLFDHGHHKAGGATPLIGEADQATIDRWKSENTGGIYKVSVGGHVVYFRNPRFEDMNYGYSGADMNAPLDTWQRLADVTKIGGSDAVLGDPKLFPGVMKAIQKKCEGAKAELEDL